MTIIRILQYPDPRLRTKGETVTDFGPETQKIIDDMFETHYAQTNCAALAATQLDFEKPKRITVIDFSEKKDQPLCLVNPEITEYIGSMIEEEGCMSVGLAAHVFEKVKRAEKIKVKAQDRHGKPIELEAEGYMAKCIQHEIDHLNGKIFLDHLSSLKRSRVNERLKKFNKLQSHRE